uniref:Uncharacterized protein n=2 Tax=Auxenochlorella protothecoides TaxID=3075 RepID=A0A1D2AC68_AUXPR
MTYFAPPRNGLQGARDPRPPRRTSGPPGRGAVHQQEARAHPPSAIPAPHPALSQVEIDSLLQILQQQRASLQQGVTHAAEKGDAVVPHGPMGVEQAGAPGPEATDNGSHTGRVTHAQSQDRATDALETLSRRSQTSATSPLPSTAAGWQSGVPMPGSASPPLQGRARGFLASVQSLRPGPTRAQAEEAAAKQAALKADLARQVQEKRAADAARRAEQRAQEEREEAEIQAYHQRLAVRDDGPGFPMAAGAPGREAAAGRGTRLMAAGSSVRRGAVMAGPPRPGRSAGGADMSGVHPDSPPPTLARDREPLGEGLDSVSPSLAALLSGIQEQQRSLQEGLAGQAASMDRLELTLLSARRERAWTREEIARVDTLLRERSLTGSGQPRDAASLAQFTKAPPRQSGFNLDAVAVSRLIPPPSEPASGTPAGQGLRQPGGVRQSGGTGGRAPFRQAPRLTGREAPIPLPSSLPVPKKATAWTC